MKIKFKKKRLISTLIFAIVWIGIGLYSVIDRDNSRWPNVIHLLFGVLFLGQYLYDLTNQYLIIKNGTIIKKRIIGSNHKIKLDDINYIKHFAGDYILYSKQKKLTINSQLIEKNSFLELKKMLANLNLPSEKTPFAKSL
ncbi:hypothetical protein [Psychroserpens sp. Hel_I_66]|uniref:hypothetical protein n=1 Tax=Psychroserpens sp. Hel_I_66 TaxID=1250004 RepID=UPI000646B09B|nr:hypothetical protein [Psychroserpens sp. Hel_I_66]